MTDSTSILELDTTVQDGLKRSLGGKDPLAVISIDTEGGIQLHKSTHANQHVAPIDGPAITTTSIVNITPIAVVSHKVNPFCITVTIGGLRCTICYP